MPSQFVWYELMTSDPRAAEAFYDSVVGWTPHPWSEEPRYTLLAAGEARVAGIMAIPPEAEAAGGRPCWFGYVGVPDVDAETEAVRAAGGAVHRAPDDIPGIGRFSVVTDPQGAFFMLFQPLAGATPPPPVPPNTPGHVGWRELYSDDWERAFAFYAARFAWTKDMAVDMGAMGTYQTFAAGGPAIGGMMNRMPQTPRSVWQFYFNVEDIEAAAARVREAGGAVLMGPHQVPGGSWIVNCADPQGAHFALVAPPRA